MAVEGQAKCVLEVLCTRAVVVTIQGEGGGIKPVKGVLGSFDDVARVVQLVPVYPRDYPHPHDQIGDGAEEGCGAEERHVEYRSDDSFVAVEHVEEVCGHGSDWGHWMIPQGQWLLLVGGNEEGVIKG